MEYKGVFMIRSVQVRFCTVAEVSILNDLSFLLPSWVTKVKLHAEAQPMWMVEKFRGRTENNLSMEFQIIMVLLSWLNH